MCNEFDRAANAAFLQFAPQRQETTVPATIVEDAEQSAGPSGRGNHVGRFSDVQRKWLVDDDVVSGRQRGDREGVMRIVRVAITTS